MQRILQESVRQANIRSVWMKLQWSQLTIECQQISDGKREKMSVFIKIVAKFIFILFCSKRLKSQGSAPFFLTSEPGWLWEFMVFVQPASSRSEERRVGKECRSRWAADDCTKK